VLKANRFESSKPPAQPLGLTAFADGRFDVVVVDILLEDAVGYDVIEPCVSVLRICANRSGRANRSARSTPREARRRM
jgi:hypothetical protein